MSDGHFNRALLPKDDLAAGIRLGRAQMRAKAEQALRQLLTEQFPTLTSEEVAALHDQFRALLRS